MMKFFQKLKMLAGMGSFNTSNLMAPTKTLRAGLTTGAVVDQRLKIVDAQTQ